MDTFPFIAFVFIWSFLNEPNYYFLQTSLVESQLLSTLLVLVPLCPNTSTAVPSNMTISSRFSHHNDLLWTTPQSVLGGVNETALEYQGTFVKIKKDHCFLIPVAGCLKHSVSGNCRYVLYLPKAGMCLLSKPRAKVLLTEQFRLVLAGHESVKAWRLLFICEVLPSWKIDVVSIMFLPFLLIIMFLLWLGNTSSLMQSWFKLGRENIPHSAFDFGCTRVWCFSGRRQGA